MRGRGRSGSRRRGDRRRRVLRAALESSGLGELLPGTADGTGEVVMVMGAAVHDFRIDQGRILAIRPNAIALLERDGSRQTNSHRAGDGGPRRQPGRLGRSARPEAERADRPRGRPAGSVDLRHRTARPEGARRGLLRTTDGPRRGGDGRRRRRARLPHRHRPGAQRQPDVDRPAGAGRDEPGDPDLDVDRGLARQPAAHGSRAGAAWMCSPSARKISPRRRCVQPADVFRGGENEAR